jgi:diguanylate cyclase (GGDEF)-like protein
MILPMALLGILLITLEAAATGGTHSHLLALYVVPVIFTAALLRLRLTALVIGLAVAAAALPLLGGWNGFYVRSLMLLAGVMMLSAYVETRLLGTAVTEKAAAEYQALHDDLTGLPNRAFFFQSVREAIQFDPEARLAVLLMDLDLFKDINDTLGHQRGDRVLRELGRRLQDLLRAPGTVVARLGGDEFGILLARPHDAEGTDVAKRLLESLGQGIMLEDLDIALRASIGVALYPEHGRDIDALVQKADVAMYQAKAARSGYSIYTPGRDPYSTERLELIGELQRAIENMELVLHYQPEVDLRTRRIVGVEALVRWQNPRRGLLMPERFIPLAEHSGLMRSLSREVLTMALGQCRTWRDAGIDLVVAVNVAAADLLDLQFPHEVESLLRDQDVPPSRLKLEITEGTIMADPVRARAVLTRLHAMGVGLSVDDFGTGYSSLAYLRQLPVDEIKIDRSFITEMETEASDAVIVRAIIDLGRNLGLQVVAEGVEREGTWDQLAALGCELAQGYCISPPLPEKALSLWIAKWPHPATDVQGRPGLRLIG